MTDSFTGDASRPQPTPIDLAGVTAPHPDAETPEQLLGTTVAETTVGVTGVHHLGGLAARTLDRARRQVLGTSSAPGVTVSTEDGVTTIDLDLVVEYPHRIDDVIDETRVQVTHAARQLATGPVTVNITVTGVHGPFDQDPAVLDAIDRAGDQVQRFREAAADRVDRVVAAIDEKADDLNEPTDLDELDAKADEKLRELDEEASRKDLP